MEIYLFGRFNGNFTQYPRDFSSDYFKSLISNNKSEAKVAIHRDDCIIYYSYVRKISDGFFGMSVAMNGQYLGNIKAVFSAFEQVFEKIVNEGALLKISPKGDISSAVKELYQETEAVKTAESIIIQKFENLVAKYSNSLPPVNFSTGANSSTTLCLEDHANEEIISSSYTFGNTIVLKSKDYDSIRLNSVKTQIRNANKKIKEQQDELTKLRAQQKNIKVVSVLGVVVAIMAVILYFKVINPSEVTRYDAGEFTYYGPLKDKKPHGVGVAIYPADDPDGRLYYIGNFVDGERQDSAARLFYQDGDYFYGEMEGDNWQKGLWYSSSDHSHYEGRFLDNEPVDGWWYDHKKTYKVKQ